MTPVRFDVRAVVEIESAIRYFSEQRPSKVGAFTAALDVALARLATYPRGAPIVAEGLRALRVPGFRYRILYSEEPSEVVVVSFFHEARSPDDLPK